MTIKTARATLSHCVFTGISRNHLDRLVAVLHGVDRSTISTAIRHIRPLLANRGFATSAGVRLHTTDIIRAITSLASDRAATR